MLKMSAINSRHCCNSRKVLIKLCLLSSLAIPNKDVLKKSETSNGPRPGVKTSLFKFYEDWIENTKINRNLLTPAELLAETF